MFAPGRVYGEEKSMVGGSASRKVRSYGREYRTKREAGRAGMTIWSRPREAVRGRVRLAVWVPPRGWAGQSGDGD